MSRSELVYRLAKAGAQGDRDALEQTMDLLVSEAQQEGRHSHARRLSGVLRPAKPSRAPEGKVVAGARLPESVSDLLLERPARRFLRDLILPEGVVADVRDFLAEQEHAALLRAHSLEPRHALLLTGPPGNGKTSLAETLAAELGLPFLTVRYEGVVDSFLGETATRIRRIVDYAAKIPCLLFFDEFDAVAKERADIHETGEIKRVVSSLLVQLEALPSHCVVVCATNHPELLDSAVWRRFELKIVVPQPGPAQVARMYAKLVRELGTLELSEEDYIRRMSDRSMSDIEQFNLDVKRKMVLSKGTLNPSQAVGAIMERWTRQFGPTPEKNKKDGGPANRQDAAPPRRGKKNKGRPTTAVSQEDLLRGAG